MPGSLKKLFGGEEKEEGIIAAPVGGTAISMGQVSDPTFSQEILGKGTAVISSDGRAIAPADGLVTIVSDTKHATSTWTDSGAELIVHIDLDMVQLKGQYSEAYVAARDKVKQGNLLLDSKIDKIKGAGYDMITLAIICNTP